MLNSHQHLGEYQLEEQQVLAKAHLPLTWRSGLWSEDHFRA